MPNSREPEVDLKYLNDEPEKAVDTIITIACLAILIFFAAPDLVRWVWGLL